MKKLIIAFSLTISAFSILLSQESTNRPSLILNYGHLEYHSVDLGLSFKFKKGITLDLASNILWKYAPSEPEDFNKAVYKNHKSIDFLIGKTIHQTQNKKIQIKIAQGIGFVQSNFPVNWKRKESSGGFGFDFCFFSCAPNYTYDYHKYYSISLIAKTRIEYRFHPLIGISFEPNVRLIHGKLYPMLSFGIIAGS